MDVGENFNSLFSYFDVSDGAPALWLSAIGQWLEGWGHQPTDLCVILFFCHILIMVEKFRPYSV